MWNNGQHLVYTCTHTPDEIMKFQITSCSRGRSRAAVQTLCVPLVHLFYGGRFQPEYHVYTGEWMTSFFKSGVGRRVRATIRCFYRGTSILAHLKSLGYGPGRHKQPKHTYTEVVCVVAPSEKVTLVEPSRNISRVTPLFSRLPLHQTYRARV